MRAQRAAHSIFLLGVGGMSVWSSAVSVLRSRRWASASSRWLVDLVAVVFAARAAAGRSGVPSRWRVFRSLLRAGVAPVVAAAFVRASSFPGAPLSPAASLAWRSLGWRLSPGGQYPRYAAMPGYDPLLSSALLAPAAPGRVLPVLARAFSPVCLREACRGSRA